ncbi:hypothetical protein GGP41_000384 [Bipolaris sorokiniana]|uniref:Cytochrome P450 monooxygenase n=1 Tax=Cochliobolus sativus TaxID=45130 RepID=A0A8H6DTM7_COCSA|nr:hypothetical protein GGP41_000384 [Bipolaris sorokiniana]
MNDLEQQGRGDFLNDMVQKRKQPSGLNDLETIVNADILIGAGAETSAIRMTRTLFWLLRSPKVIAKAQEEVRSKFSSQYKVNFVTSTSELPFMVVAGVNQYAPYLEKRNFHRPEEYLCPRWDEKVHRNPK